MNAVSLVVKSHKLHWAPNVWRTALLATLLIAASVSAATAQQVTVRMPDVGTIYTYIYWDGDGPVRINERTAVFTVDRYTRNAKMCPEDRTWTDCVVEFGKSSRASLTRVLVDGRVAGIADGFTQMDEFRPLTRDYVMHSGMKTGDTWSYVFNPHGRSYEKRVTVRDWGHLDLSFGHVAVIRVTQTTDDNPSYLEEYYVLEDGTIARYQAIGFKDAYGFQLENIKKKRGM